MKGIDDNMGSFFGQAVDDAISDALTILKMHHRLRLFLLGCILDAQIEAPRLAALRKLGISSRLIETIPNGTSNCPFRIEI
jgi:hypothetical protein